MLYLVFWIFFIPILDFDKVAFIGVYTLKADLCHMYGLIDTKFCILVGLGGSFFSKFRAFAIFSPILDFEKQHL